MTAPHFVLCPRSLLPHRPEAPCTCDPARLAAAIERERERAQRPVVRVTRVVG
jgi:uncharacterized protein (DUF362 family)